MIQKITQAEIPARRGRPSPLAPVMRLVLALPKGEALQLPTDSLAHAKRIQTGLARLARHHRVSLRVRTFDDAIYVWNIKGKEAKK